jgi:hypothetical protein
MIGWIVAGGVLIVLAGVVVVSFRVLVASDDEEVRALAADDDIESDWGETDDADAAFVPWPVPAHSQPTHR